MSERFNYSMQPARLPGMPGRDETNIQIETRGNCYGSDDLTRLQIFDMTGDLTITYLNPQELNELITVLMYVKQQNGW